MNDCPAFARRLFEDAQSAASVTASMAAALGGAPEPSVVIGGGKAGRAMAAAFTERFPNVPGCIAVPPEHAGFRGGIELMASGHPLPTDDSVRAVERQQQLLDQTGDSHQEIVNPVYFFLSGGASAMLGAPLRGVGLGDLQETYAALLASGLPVEDMNVVRRHLTRWGGGKLAKRLAGRETHAFIVSDVLSDRLEAIGSGPLAADPATFADALRVAERVRGVPGSVLRFLKAQARTGEFATLASGAAEFRHVENRIMLSNRIVTGRLAERIGAAVLPPQTGDIDAVADFWAGRLLKGERGRWIAGGEPTVVLPKHPGRGGRNQQLVLAVADRLAGRGGDCEDDGEGGWFFASIATDGVDGSSENAGGWCASGFVPAEGDRRRALGAFDASPLLERAKLAFHSGPTGSNVADVHVGIRW